MCRSAVFSCLFLLAGLLPGPVPGAEPPKRPWEDLDGIRCWNQRLFTPWLRAEVDRLRKDGRLVAKDQLVKGAKEKHLAPALPRLPAADAPLSPPALADKLRAGVVLVMSLNDKGKDNYGSGFAVADDLVVTNWHAFGLHPELPDVVVVDHAGHVLPVIAAPASDPGSDLVVLRVAGKLDGLPVAEKPPPAGERLWQMGHTHMALWAFTEGIVNRYCVENFVPDGAKESRDMIVMDISHEISKGSSGSPLVNDRGEICGVYFRSRWYYQDATNKITGGDGAAANALVLKDRYVLYERNMCVPLSRLRDLLGWGKP